MKATDLINDAINTQVNGMVFDYSDLRLPNKFSLAASKALSRMVKSGKLRKVGKGKFYKPKFTRLGELPPMIEGLTRDLLYKGGKRVGYITGTQAFSQIGLTTQISSKIIIGSNYYRRPLKRGGYDISYTKQPNEITEENVTLLRYLDALKFIKEIPAATPDFVIMHMKSIIKSLSEEEVSRMVKLSKQYPASTRALLGAIIESESGIEENLRLTLNAFTKYKIGVSLKSLPNKAKWNVI